MLSLTSWSRKISGALSLDVSVKFIYGRPTSIVLKCMAKGYNVVFFLLLFLLFFFFLKYKQKRFKQYRYPLFQNVKAIYCSEMTPIITFCQVNESYSWIICFAHLRWRHNGWAYDILSNFEWWQSRYPPWLKYWMSIKMGKTKKKSSFLLILS